MLIKNTRKYYYPTPRMRKKKKSDNTKYETTGAQTLLMGSVYWYSQFGKII